MSFLRIPALRLIARPSISASTSTRISSFVTADFRSSIVSNKRFLHQTFVRLSNDGEDQFKYSQDQSVSQNEDRASGSARQSRDASRSFNRPTQEGDGCQIFVGQLAYATSPDTVVEAFKDFGEVVHTHALRTQAGMSRGAMFITYANPEDAKKAIQEMDQQEFDGRHIHVSQATGTKRNIPSRPPMDLPTEPTNSLFIGNMSFNMTDQDLNQVFQRVKDCVDVRVAIDRRTGQPRGFAHADFKDKEAAQVAKEWLDTQVIHGRRLRINYAHPKRSDGQGSSSTGRARRNDRVADGEQIDSSMDDVEPKNQ